MSDKRFALLIDSDNISAKYIDSILDEMTRHGVATYRRIYGDFTDYHMNKWKSELAERSITPIQQFRNTTGKNATDSALIIDAMDILYAGNVEGFCIVSSDGDFTRLASRLRESGMEVIGMARARHQNRSVVHARYLQISSFYLRVTKRKIRKKRKMPFPKRKFRMPFWKLLRQTKTMEKIRGLVKLEVLL